jgi:hypothetical protein
MSERSTLMILLCTQIPTDSHPRHLPAVRGVRNECTGNMARVRETAGR